jgi:hypothetical protein
MASTDYSAVAGYRSYVETISEDIFRKLFFEFNTARLVTIHEGVKGKKVWTEMKLLNLAKAYFPAFSAGDTNQLVPIEMDVSPFKVEHKEIPQEIEDTHLGFLRRNSFNHQEWPLERYSVEQLLAKLQQELEVAVWQGVKKSTALAAGDSINIVFNGYLKIIADAITATTVTAVVTGAITEANILEKLKLMYAELAPELKTNGTDIFVSYALFDHYVAAMDTKFAGNSAPYVELGSATYQGMRYRQGGGNTTLIPVAGMGDSGRVIMLPRANFHMGIDSLADFSNFNFEQQVRELLYWLDAKIGVQITLLRDGIAVVNDQA